MVFIQPLMLRSAIFGFARPQSSQFLFILYRNGPDRDRWRCELREKGPHELSWRAASAGFCLSVQMNKSSGHAASYITLFYTGKQVLTQARARVVREAGTLSP